MPKVDIAINNRHYSVACDEGQEGRVRDLAAMMDSRVRQLGSPVPGGAAAETQLLVLAGLMLADELTEAKAALNTPSTSSAAASLDDDLLVAAVDHLVDRIDDIAGRLGRA